MLRPCGSLFWRQHVRNSHEPEKENSPVDLDLQEGHALMPGVFPSPVMLSEGKITNPARLSVTYHQTDRSQHVQLT